MCSLCPSPDDDGALEWWGEGLSVPPADATPESKPVCMRCLRWFGHVLDLAARPHDMDPGVLGFPARREGGRACMNCCNFCLGELGGERFTVSLSQSRTSITDRQWPPRQYRLCRGCFTWARLAVHDRTALSGTSHRAGEGAMGSWRQAAARDACMAYLDPRDAFTVEATLTAMHRQVARITMRCTWECGLIGGSGGAAGHALPTAHGLVCGSDSGILLAAGQDGRAREFVGTLSPEQRARVFVVARQDTLSDAFEALRAGAAELLSSPLSPQQVSGALDRMGQPGLVSQRNRNGVPAYRVAASNGISAHGFAIRPGERMPAASLLLLLRRFVRGYDLVGQWPDNRLQVVAFCDDARKGAVLERLKLAAGRSAVVELRESAPAGAARELRAG
ncbi:MAG: hypothetical protein IT303_17940 [Dehalococcoidia bacterium]|nr:hypothetical protein [Dehalococcoidia bacterium]